MDTERDFLRPINNTSIVQKVINRLTRAMINRELRAGDKIPTEMELANSFGVGRNSVREAIKVLSSFGVLEVRRPEGTFVTQGFSDKMIDPLLYGIILDESKSLESLKELREWMDWGILRLAARHADEDDISAIEKKFDELKDALRQGTDIDRIFNADNDFHETLDRAAHNSLFAKITDLVRKLTSEIRLRTVRAMSDMGKLNEMESAHEMLMNAVKTRNVSLSSDIIVYSYFYHYDVLKE